MKYDIDLDPQSANTSHVLVLDLVGSGKRVLDVGCSTGYLAAALRDRGNSVVGVEVDPAAAELARPHLDRLVIGDLTTLDLAAELGEHGFDAIVFADVLEHVPDPLAVLRQAPALLAPGGSVVVSIPNVAHGAVRLSLLQGRFEYQDLGLLDSTHLRFFTRSSLDEMLRLAGLMPVEQRRTVAEPFATEIPVSAEDFPREVVDALRVDADATTYQFVVRSVVAEGSTTGDLATELAARNEEILGLRQQLAQVGVAAPRTRPPTLGVIAASGDDPSDELRTMVVDHEVRRRLPDWACRRFDWGGSGPRPAADGAPVEPFRADGAPTERSATSLDCVVLTGAWTAQAVADASEVISADGCPVHLAAPGGLEIDELQHLRRPGAVAAWRPDHDVRLVPDPLLLAARLVAPEILAHRSMLLAALGLLPPSAPGYILTSVVRADAAALGRALEGLAQADGLDVAVVPGPSDDAVDLARAIAAGTVRALAATEALPAIDLLAAVSSAQLVVTDRAELLWLAVGLGRPCIGLRPPAGHDPDGKALGAVTGWISDPDLAVATPGALGGAVDLARRRAADGGATIGAADQLDLFLDELAGALASSGARRLSVSWPTALAEANHRADTIARVNDGLRHRLLKERIGFGGIARRVVSGGDVSVTASEHKILADKLVRAEAEVARMQAEVADLVHQIEATNATLTMRTLAPARRFYGRLRNR